MLKSKRQIASTFQTPIKKISGHVDKYSTLETANSFKQGETRTFVTLNMSNVTILDIDAGASHPYKTADIPIGNFSDFVGSGYVMFEDSIANVLGIDKEETCVDKLVGLDVTLERVDNHVFGKKKDGTEAKGTWWKVVSAGGKTGADPMTTFLGMLDGQKKGDVIGNAVSNAVIKTDSKLVQDILTGSIFTDPRVTSVYTMDASDVFHKVA
jgi:hypothetical protein